MDPINHLNVIERNLCNKADLARIPIAGNVELLPLCNMDCKMCFAKMTKSEMEQHSPMHDYKEWLEVFRQARDAGTLFMLLTGGEPFLYPNIKELYQEMRKLGLIISFNTNGTLIDEEIVEWLAADPPRRLNITLYGASDETYSRLCGNPKGFSKVMTAVQLLKENGISIKFNCSLTPYNIHDLDEIYRLSEELDIPIELAYYMYPPVRKNNIGNEKYRLNPIDAAKARFRIQELKYKEDHSTFVKEALKSLRDFKQQKEYTAGYGCRSGNSVYWINYDGTMSACSFTNDCVVNVFEKGFDNAWYAILDHVSKSYMPVECHTCSMQVLCGHCAASCISENGNISKAPFYYCELTKHYIELLEEAERNYYEN